MAGRNRRRPAARARRAPGTSAPASLAAWFLVGLVASVLAACIDVPRQPPLPRLAADDVVLAFGDSLTHGTGAGPEHAYPAQLERRIARRVVAAGVPGETTEQGLQRLPSVLDQHAPKLVILCLGGNDFLRRLDPAATRANLARMLSLLRERGVAVVLVGVPSAFGAGEAARLYADLGREFSVPVEDRAFAVALADRTLRADPIHLNAEGYSRVADAVSTTLRRAGAL